MFSCFISSSFGEITGKFSGKDFAKKLWKTEQLSLAYSSDNIYPECSSPTTESIFIFYMRQVRPDLWLAKNRC